MAKSIKKETVFQICGIVIAVVAFVCAVLALGKMLNKNSVNESDVTIYSHQTQKAPTLLFEGKNYRMRDDLEVIVIMGILSAFVIPRISSMVLETREQIYVQDAKKLLAQAQYRMNSNSVDIDKPEMGECIIFSLI